MKKSILYDRAEQLYVEDLWTYEQVAQELKCSGRTIRNWAKDGRWELKRNNLAEMQQSLHQDARDIAMLLARKIKGQLEEDKMPAPHILNAFTRMSLTLLRAKEYEKECEAEAEVAQDDEKTIEAARAKFKEVFGVDLPI